MDHDKIREALQDRLLHVVAEKTGLHRHTVAKVRDGGVATKPVMKLLAMYLGVKDE
jgi:hypothetical protein